MKHDPLCDGNNAFLSLVQSRELRLDGVVCVGHIWEEVTFGRGEIRADGGGVRLALGGRQMIAIDAWQRRELKV